MESNISLIKIRNLSHKKLLNVLHAVVIYKAIKQYRSTNENSNSPGIGTMTGIDKIMWRLHVRGISLEELEMEPSRREDSRESQV